MILYDSLWKNLVFNEGVATAMATTFSLGPRVSILTGSLKGFVRALEWMTLLLLGSSFFFQYRLGHVVLQELQCPDLHIPVFLFFFKPYLSPC